MILEDFLSMTKMKDGLTAPSRVGELVSIMQKEKDSVVKNIGDATRQWAAVASAIAATENRDCLDQFIQLDGLWFIDRWLKDAQQCANDTNEGFVEESITAMLRALEKLHIDNERSISSGILITVKSLLGHSSSQVQDRARSLFDSWKQGRISEALDHDANFVGSSHDNDIAVSAIHAKESSRTESSILVVPLPKPSANEENNGAEILPSSSECRQLKNDEDAQTKTNNNEPCFHIKLDDVDVEDKPPDHPVPSKLSNSVPENCFMEGKFPVGTVGRTVTVETCNSPAPSECCNEEQLDALKMNELSKDEKHVSKITSLPDKVCVTASASTGTVEPRAVSSAADVASGHEITSGPALKNNFDANEGDSDVKATIVGDVMTHTSESKSGMDDMEVADNNSTPVYKSSGEAGFDGMLNSSGNEYAYEKHKDLETSFSRIKGSGAADADNDRSSDGGSRSRNDSNFSKPAMAPRNSDAANRGTSDIELEYGIIDALEVARKVAQEVEREVVDYRERSCSSSEKISGNGLMPLGSPESVNEKQDPVNEVPSEEVPPEKNYSAEAHPEGEGQLVNLDNVETKPENGITDMGSSRVIEAAQEQEVNLDKGLCDFDLNQEVCSDDTDHPVNPVNPVSTPIPVVSASRPAAAPGLPAAPLQFEGSLGWKGTAATSAFRPASPRRNCDSDKTNLCVAGGNNSSKQRHAFLDIDLNVADSVVDEKPAEQIPETQIPVSSSLRSTESSLGTSPKRSERLSLDLNRISDDSDALPSDLRMERRGVYNRNGHRSPSPASSSSSMQHSLRNIDLNDRPYLNNDFSDQDGPHHGRTSQNISSFGLPRPDDPVISIMGARVEVNRKDFIPQISSMPNGKTLDATMDGNLARSGSVLRFGSPSFTHSPAFGYNGFTTAPTLSYSSPIYGPGNTIPYMVDTRGAPVVPQIVGSATAVPPSYSQAPPFIMNMTSASSGLNGALGPNFDLNSGFPIEGANRDSLGLRQLFMPSQGRSMDEHLRASSQPSSSSSGAGGKRKEPDSGWENYPLNYRHQQRPWK